MLLEQLGQRYHEVKVEFKALEDVETTTRIDGAALPMAHYTIAVNLRLTSAAPTPAPAKPRPKRENESA
jgi:hypothetical protein